MGRKMSQTQTQINKRLIILPSIPPNAFYPNDFIIKARVIKSDVELGIILGQYDEIINYNRHEPTNKYLARFNANIKNISGAYTYQKGDDILVMGLKGRTPKSGQDMEISGFNDLVIYLVKVEVE